MATARKMDTQATADAKDTAKATAEATIAPRSEAPAKETPKDPAPARPSRWSLRLRAATWRSLQYAGMALHFAAAPRPPAPAFTRTVQSTLARQPGLFELQVYVPADYDAADQSARRRPCIVNFHGGGFVLGAATDDARFAAAVVAATGAVFVSVDYRMAPECPFPTPVDDCADALRYVAAHARDLRIDPRRIATTGFSAGGNLCLTALLRLDQARTDSASSPGSPNSIDDSAYPNVLATIAWYPILDFCRSRADRRASCVRPDQVLPTMLTSLFDASYMHPSPDMCDPLLSPAQASDDQLARALPPHVRILTCEWDMLQAEGADFAARLAGPPLNKDVAFKMVPGVPHGWDKSPNPRRQPEGVEALYQECGQWLKDIFEAEEKQSAD